MRSNVFRIYLSPRCMIQILFLGGADVTSRIEDSTSTIYENRLLWNYEYFNKTGLD